MTVLRLPSPGSAIPVLFASPTFVIDSFRDFAEGACEKVAQRSVFADGQQRFCTHCCLLSFVFGLFCQRESTSRSTSSINEEICYQNGLLVLSHTTPRGCIITERNRIVSIRLQHNTAMRRCLPPEEFCFRQQNNGNQLSPIRRVIAL